MTYGDKRDYPKIDLYVDHTYVCSTTWYVMQLHCEQN